MTSHSVPGTGATRRGRWLVPSLAAFIFASSVLSAVCLRFVLPASFRMNESSDYAAFYAPVAVNIMAGRGVTLNDGSSATRYPPGFPVLLAATYRLSDLAHVPRETGATALTILSFGLAAMLLFLTARMFWKPLAALATALVWTSYPLAVWLAKQPNSEVPFMVLLFGAALVLSFGVTRQSLKWHIYLGAGLLLGCAMLIRPAGIAAALAAVFVILLLLRRAPLARRLVPAFLLMLGSLTAVLPWEIWAGARTGRVVFLSDGGPPGVYDGLTFAVAVSSFRGSSSLPDDVVQVMRDVERDRSAGASYVRIGKVLGDELRIRPGAVLKLLALKVARSLYATDSGRRERAILPLQIVYLLLILFASGRLWGGLGDARGLVIGVWLPVLGFWVLTMMVLSIARYMVPAMGLLFLLIPGVLARPRIPATAAT